MGPRELGGELDLDIHAFSLRASRTFEFFLNGRLKNKRGDVTRLPPVYPRGVPKGGLRTIFHSDDGGGIEEIKVILVACVAHGHPKLGWIFPLIPWPTYPKRSRKLGGV